MREREKERERRCWDGAPRHGLGADEPGLSARLPIKAAMRRQQIKAINAIHIGYKC